LTATANRAGSPCDSTGSIEQSAVFDVVTTTGALKETVQKGQQLVWHARRSPNDRRFELTDMSVAFLRSEAPTEVKITFAGHVSAFGWRPESDPKTPGDRSYPGRRVDLFLEFRRFRALRQQQPAATAAEPSGAERHRRQSVQQRGRGGNFRIPRAECSDPHRAAVSVMRLVSRAQGQLFETLHRPLAPAKTVIGHGRAAAASDYPSAPFMAGLVSSIPATVFASQRKMTVEWQRWAEAV
jgi:hypothetical protein